MLKLVRIYKVLILPKGIVNNYLKALQKALNLFIFVIFLKINTYNYEKFIFSCPIFWML